MHALKIIESPITVLVAVLALSPVQVESAPPPRSSGAALIVRSDETALLLGIDDHLLPLRSNLALYLSKPKVRAKPVLTPDRSKPNSPDFIATQFYGTVLHDQGKFRMWYYGLHYLSKPSDLHPGPVCYAESADGIQWTRPNLGQVEIKGSRDNNAIKLPDDQTWFTGVIRENDDPDPSRRYKMVYDTKNGSAMPCRTATSPDGIHWTASPDYAIRTFIELSSFYKHKGLYVANGQFFPASEGGQRSGRQGGAIVSPNFDDWIPAYANAFLIREPADPARRGGGGIYDQVHLGVGAASFGNVAVGLFGLWHNHAGDASRDIPAAWFGFNKTSCDLSLVISNDGLHFREPAKGHVYLSRQDSPVTPIVGKKIPTILIQSGNGLLNVGDETRIYHGRWRNSEYGLEYWAEVALATLPRDRWGALGLRPNASTGDLWSAPVKLPDAYTRVSVNAEGAHGLSVDIVDENFRPLPEYSGKNGGAVRDDDGLDCPVVWPNGNLVSLHNRTVRFRFRFTRTQGAGLPKILAGPRLFCVYLKSASEARRLTVAVNDSELGAWILPRPGSALHTAGSRITLSARRLGYRCPNRFEFSHWDLGDGRVDRSPSTTLTLDRDSSVTAIYVTEALSNCEEVSLAVGNAGFEQPDVANDTRAFVEAESAPGPWKNTGHGHRNCKIHIDRRVGVAVKEESPSGGQWGLCYQEPGFPNEITQVLHSTFVEGVLYRLRAEIYWDYSGVPLKTYRLRLVGAESGEVVAEVNQDRYAPQRGWGTVEAAGTAGAGVQGENIRIILGGQDGKPLALDNIRVSASGPLELLRQ